MFLYGLVPGLFAGLVWVWYSSKYELYPENKLSQFDRKVLSILGFGALLLIAGPISIYFYSLRYVGSGNSAFWDHLFVLGVPIIILNLMNLKNINRNKLIQFMFSGLIVLIFGFVTPLMFTIQNH